MRGLRDRVGADRLGDSGRVSLEHVARGLGRDVPRGDSGSSGREHDDRLLGQLDDRIGDRVPLVGDDAPLDLVALSREQLGEQVAALVLARPLGGTVRDGDDGRSHSFTFSSKRTSPISIPESTAFAMS